MAVWGAGWFLLANILDECDGKLARQTGTSSPLGEVLDTFTDFIVHTVFFLSLGAGMTRQFPQGPWMALGIGAALGNVLSCALDFGGMTTWQPKPLSPSVESRQDLLAWVTEWFRIDFSILVLISALLRQMAWILWAGALGVFLFWIPSTLFIAMKGRVKP